MCALFEKLALSQQNSDALGALRERPPRQFDRAVFLRMWGEGGDTRRMCRDALFKMLREWALSHGLDARPPGDDRAGPESAAASAMVTAPAVAPLSEATNRSGGGSMGEKREYLESHVFPLPIWDAAADDDDDRGAAAREPDGNGGAAARAPLFADLKALAVERRDEIHARMHAIRDELFKELPAGNRWFDEVESFGDLAHQPLAPALRDLAALVHDEVCAAPSRRLVPGRQRMASSLVVGAE